MTKNRKEQLIVYLLALAGTVVYVSLIFNQNVWLDEAFTASLIRTDYKGVLLRSMSDTLPPLYNILLKAATDLFGYNLKVMKLVSLLPMAGVMLLGATRVYRRFGAKTASLFILCTAAMPNLLFYGVEVRMYSLGFFFVTACGVYAYELLLNPRLRNLILFSVMAALSGYAHHFAFAAAGFVYLFLLLYYLVSDRRNLKYWFGSLAVTGTLYLPCLLVTIKQMLRVNGYFSMPDITLSVFVKYLRYPFTTGFTPVSILLCASVLALLAAFLMRRGKSAADWFLSSYFVIYIGILLLGSAASAVMDANIFVDRYLVPSLGLLWLFLSIEAGKLPAKRFRLAAVMVCAAGVVSYSGQWRLEYQSGVEQMQEYFDAQLSSYDGYVVPYGEYEVMECMTFYYPSLTPYTVLDGRIMQAEIDYTLEKESRPADISGLNLWFLTEKADAALPPELTALRYTAEYIGDFHFDRYSFSLYNLRKDDKPASGDETLSGQTKKVKRR